MAARLLTTFPAPPREYRWPRTGVVASPVSMEISESDASRVQ